MLFVTADTNIYVSALQFAGPPLQFLERARAGAFRLAISPPIATEVRRVLNEKFAWPDRDITDALAELDDCTTSFHPTRTLNVIASDPSDDRVLECAVESASAHVVSGDHHLLQLGIYCGIEIVRVADFLRRLPTHIVS